jgi:hypothetical protein
MTFEPTSLVEVLDLFTTEEIADALFQLHLPTSGNKDERISRLLEANLLPEKLLHTFTSEALREACASVGLPTGRKTDMVAALLGGKPLTVIPSESIERKPPTVDTVAEVLRTIVVPRREAQVEEDAEWFIDSILDQHFTPVAHQYSIGGYLGTKIDVDLGNGTVGVEIKLAASLSKSTEVHRMLGQAYHYDRRRYSGNLIVAVVGTPEDLSDPLLKEMAELLEALRIACVFIKAAG